MRYCISDIHGHYTEFIKLLDRIKFSKDDELYILGDLCDRGTENLKVLEYVMNNRDNVFCLMGNHDSFLRDWLSGRMDDVLYWCKRNGGNTTYYEIKGISNEHKNDILSFISSLPYYKILGDTVLVHGGIYSRGDNGLSIENFMETLDPEDLMWARPDEVWMGYNKGPKGIKFIVGHTPTSCIGGSDEIVKRGNTVFIDCGAAYGGNLACLCIDTGEVWYEKV